jgi:hypothetical protein
VHAAERRYRVFRVSMVFSLLGPFSFWTQISHNHAFDSQVARVWKEVHVECARATGQLCQPGHRRTGMVICTAPYRVNLPTKQTLAFDVYLLSCQAPEAASLLRVRTDFAWKLGNQARQKSLHDCPFWRANPVSSNNSRGIFRLQVDTSFYRGTFPCKGKGPIDP